MDFSQKLEIARKQLNLTQEDMAKELNCSFATVNRWERGLVNPSQKMIERFENFCSNKNVKFDNHFVLVNQKNIRVITAQNLIFWFSNYKRRGQEILPELIKKLIEESVKIKKIHCPIGDQIKSVGFDCELETDESFLFIERGNSYWEFGANTSNTKAKLEADYKKRIDYLPLEERKKSTFVFVTPGIWSLSISKKGWCDSKKEWQKVIVIDGNDLELWLSYCFETSIWLYEIMIGKELNFSTLTSAWQEFKSIVSPNFSSTFFTDNRQREVDSFIEKINCKKVIKISASSRREAYGFILSSLYSNQEKLSFTEPIIVKNHNSLLEIERIVENKILILNFNIENHNFNSNNIYIIPYGKDYDEALNPIDIVLFMRHKDSLVKILEEDMCVDERKINKISRSQSCSFYSILRELRAENNIVSNEWKKIENFDSLIPLLLLGKINSEDQSDLEILKLFLDNNQDVNKYLLSIQNWKKIDDSPLFFYKGIIKVNDKEELWIQLSNEIDFFYEKLINIIKNIFMSPNPKYYLNNNERIFSGIFGKKWENNKYIVDGLLDSLILFSIWNDKQIQIDYFVKELLEAISSKEMLLTFSDYFIKFAEASPKMFLEYINKELSKNDSIIFSLFENNNNSVLNSGNDYCKLLWALELLIYDNQYKIQSCDILLKLSEKDFKYEINNSPLQCLINKFHWMNNRTALTIEEKERYILSKIDKSDKIVDVFLGMLNQDSIMMTSVYPKWKDCFVSNEELFWHQIYEKNHNIVTKILTKPFMNNHILKTFLNQRKYFSSSTYKEIIDFIKNNIKKDSTDAIYLYEYFVEKRFFLVRKNEKQYSNIIKEYSILIKLLKPSDAFEANKIYFKNFGMHGCPEISVIDKNYKVEEEKAFEFRKNLMMNLKSFHGCKLEKLISILPNNYQVGSLLVDIFGNYDEIISLIKELMMNEKYLIVISIFDIKINLCHNYLNSLDHMEFEQFLTILYNVKSEFLSKELLRNEYFEEKVFSNRLFRYDISSYEKQMLKKYNTINYLKWIFHFEKGSWNNEELINLIEQLPNEKIQNYDDQEMIVDLLKEMSNTNYSNDILKLEIRFLDCYDEFPNGLKQYYFYNPSELISILCANSDDENFNKIRYKFLFSYKLPINFHLDKINFNKFVNEFKNYNPDDSSKTRAIKQFIGQTLSRSANIYENDDKSLVVREAIESLSNDDVNIGYAVGSFNSIGMRTIGDGTKELLWSKKLEKISLDFQIDYPQCSRIISMIADDYRRMSEKDKISNYETNGLL